MFIHERRVSELGIEMKFEVCDPRTVFFFIIILKLLKK